MRSSGRKNDIGELSNATMLNSLEIVEWMSNLMSSSDSSSDSSSHRSK